MNLRLILNSVVLALAWTYLSMTPAKAQDEAALAEFARKAQDPLGDALYVKPEDRV